jgi:hypothetical protein
MFQKLMLPLHLLLLLRETLLYCFRLRTSVLSATRAKNRLARNVLNVATAETAVDAMIATDAVTAEIEVTAEIVVDVHPATTATHVMIDHPANDSIVRTDLSVVHARTTSPWVPTELRWVSDTR